MGNERTALMENDSRISNSSKSGNEKKFSLPLNCFSSSNRNLLLKKKLTKQFPLYNSSLNPFIINSPNKYKFIYQLISEKCNCLEK